MKQSTLFCLYLFFTACDQYRLVHLEEFMKFDCAYIRTKIVDITLYGRDYQILTEDSTVYVFDAYNDEGVDGLRSLSSEVKAGDHIFKTPYSDTVYFDTARKGRIYYLVENKKAMFDIPRRTNNIEEIKESND